VAFVRTIDQNCLLDLFVTNGWRSTRWANRRLSRQFSDINWLLASLHFVSNDSSDNKEYDYDDNKHPGNTFPWSKLSSHQLDRFLNIVCERDQLTTYKFFRSVAPRSR